MTAIVVSGPSFRALLSGNGKAAFAMLRLVVGRLREADVRRLEFGAYAVGERFARLLLDYADRYGETAPARAGVVVPLSQTELAHAAGASREAVAKVLKRLRELGAVRTARRRIEVLRPELLRRLADGEPSVYLDAEQSGPQV